jgi:hypothetical protein
VEKIRGSVSLSLENLGQKFSSIKNKKIKNLWTRFAWNSEMVRPQDFTTLTLKKRLTPKQTPDFPFWKIPLRLKSARFPTFFKNDYSWRKTAPINNK